MERIAKVADGEAPPAFAPQRYRIVPTPRRGQRPYHFVPMHRTRACLNCGVAMSSWRFMCVQCHKSFPPGMKPRQRARWFVIHAYGGACACCGESREPFLAIDHIAGGGNKHRKEIRACGR